MCSADKREAQWMRYRPQLIDQGNNRCYTYYKLCCQSPKGFVKSDSTDNRWHDASPAIRRNRQSTRLRLSVIAQKQDRTISKGKCQALAPVENLLFYLEVARQHFDSRLSRLHRHVLGVPFPIFRAEQLNGADPIVADSLQPGADIAEGHNTHSWQ